MVCSLQRLHIKCNQLIDKCVRVDLCYWPNHSILHNFFSFSVSVVVVVAPIDIEFRIVKQWNWFLMNPRNYFCRSRFFFGLYIGMIVFGYGFFISFFCVCVLFVLIFSSYLFHCGRLSLYMFSTVFFLFPSIISTTASIFVVHPLRFPFRPHLLFFFHILLISICCFVDI